MRVLNNEPTEAVSGDTWLWTRDLADYPAGTWTLTYYFKNRTQEFTIAATADGTTHVVAAAKATTAAYQPGEYHWTAVVDDGAERKTVERGTLIVLPDPAATGAGYDGRTHARKVLDAIEAVLENRATMDQEEYSIGGRSLKRTPVKDLMAMHEKYRALVNAEENRDAVANGRAPKNRMLVRL